MANVSLKKATQSRSSVARSTVQVTTVAADDTPDINECSVTGRLVSCDLPTKDGQPIRMRLAIRQADGHREVVDCEASRPAAIRTIQSAAQGSRLSLVCSVRKRFWRSPGAGLSSRTYLEVHRAAKLR